MKNYSGYQQHYEKGKYIGTGRGTSRFRLIRWYAIKGASVLDLGCSNGMLAIESKRQGASRVVGVDEGSWIRTLRQDMKEENLDVDFWEMDIESPEFKRFCPKFDVIFYCALLGHLKDPIGMLHWIDEHCNKLLYFESNLGEHNIQQINLVHQETSFKTEGPHRTDADVPEEGIRHMWTCFKVGKEKRISSWRDAEPTFIPINELCPVVRPENTRKTEKYKTVLESIKRIGLVHPLIISPTAPDFSHPYRVREGGSRYCALSDLGYKMIPCKIVPPGSAKEDILI